MTGIGRAEDRVSWDTSLPREAVALLREIAERMGNSSKETLDHEWSCLITQGTGAPCDCGHTELFERLWSWLEGE